MPEQFVVVAFPVNGTKTVCAIATLDNTKSAIAESKNRLINAF
jgi:hypothetical protein